MTVDGNGSGDAGHDLADLTGFTFQAVAQQQRGHAGLAGDLGGGLQRELRGRDHDVGHIIQPRIAGLRRFLLRALQMLLDKYAPHLRPGEDYRPPVAEEIARTAVMRIDIESWSGKKKEVEDFPGAFWYNAPSILPSVRERVQA